MDRRWGPEPTGEGRARFRLWAPDRKTVTLEIRGEESFAMEPESGSWFAVEAPADVGTHYRFRLPSM